jgi:sarcosine oxidase subunit alpha
MGWAIGKKKPDFVGMRGLARPDLQDPNRKQLVGLLTDDQSKLEEGAQIVFDPDQPIPMTMVGHVTSSYDCGTTDRPIAMALVQGGHAKMGQTVYIPMPDRTITATITETVFVDPDNSRLKIQPQV